VNVEQEPVGHALNNVLCKIIGSAELALDRVSDPVARAELEAIIALAEEAGRVAPRLRPPPAG